jgi:predicted GNAT family acetyltransferase
MKTGDANVEHDPKRNRFVARFPEGDAELAYVRVAAGTLDLTHTFVPPALRGRGIAEALVRAALAHARQQHLKLIPTCPYVARWLDRHPQERELVTTRTGET